VTAHEGNRTLDLFLTKEVLYRLSYVGELSFTLAAGSQISQTRLLVPLRSTGAPLFRASGAVVFILGRGSRTRPPPIPRLRRGRL
jgi:hypothetical protein